MSLWLATAIVLVVSVVSAQQPVLKLTAASANVTEPGTAVRIDIARWSTDQESNQLFAALNPSRAPATPAAAPRGDDDTDTPAAAPAAAAGRGGRGGGRGGANQGRGGARGGAAAPPADPIALFTTAIGKAPTIGYIWTNEVAGYAIKHAVRRSAPDGSESILLVTNRRIGANAPSWKPVKGNPTNYEFTLVEIRLNSRGSGEAKSSLTSNVTLDREAKTIGLDNYTAAPTLLENVKRP